MANIGFNLTPGYIGAVGDLNIGLILGATAVANSGLGYTGRCVHGSGGVSCWHGLITAAGVKL